MFKKAISVFTAALFLLLLASSVSAGALSLKEVTADRTDKAPVIDGVFDPSEGWGDPVIHLEGAQMKDYAETDPGYEGLLDDPSVMISNLDIYMRWTDTAFYYCARVTDSEHYNPEMDAAIWRGDSIIFHVVSVPNDDTRARILFGLDNDGVSWSFQETTEDDTEECSTAYDWLITRDETTKVTTYEANFLWKEIIPAGTLGAGEVFYLRDLFLLANKNYPEPVVAVVPEGYTNGKRNYYKITLGGEAGTDAEPAQEEPAAQEPAKAEEPAQPEEPAAEEPVKTEEPAQAAPETEAAAPETEPAAEPPASTPETKAAAGAAPKSGCGSFIGGGWIALFAVFGCAWIGKRK